MMMDPELRAAGRILRVLLHPLLLPVFYAMDRIGRLLRPAPPADLQVREVFVPRADGSRLRLMIYRPLQSDGALPGLLWAHGGGYVFGRPEQDVPVYRALIAAAPCVIVAADYRLAPEAPYPAALDDCYDALLWLRDAADVLGVRADQLAVAGMSAGGGLAAALSLRARDRDEVRIAFQMPIYPMLDDRLQTPSSRDNDAPVWNTRHCRRTWKAYLGPLQGASVPPYAAPARATDYRRLPPTCSFVGGLEPFRDEAEQYVSALRAAGVPVAFALYEGAYHGFDVLVPGARISRQARAFLLDWFAAAVRQYFAPQAGARISRGAV